MKYCKRCVQPDTRPGSAFNEEGVCPPCEYSEKMHLIDWSYRQDELNHIIRFGKETNVSGYDCIIGVSGGKDSTRQAMHVKYEMGMKPLLICCSYPPEQLTERGAYNVSNLINLGFDMIIVSPAPQTWKKLMREGFLKQGNWARSTEMALNACLPRMAIAYHIPLVYLGENPALTLGELDVQSINWDANRMKHSNTIKDGPLELLTDDMTQQDIIWYKYPNDEEMDWANMKIVYLGYFWKNFTKLDNAAFAISHGIEIREDRPENLGASHPFEALDDDFVVVNQMVKHVKFGFGKVTDEVCEEIRFRGMTREEAFDIVRKYDGKCGPEYVERFCRYLEISEKDFWEVVEHFRNQDLWKMGNNGYELIHE